MKTLDQAVIELNGEWKTSFEYMVISKDGKIHFTDVNGLPSERLASYFFHMAFRARAKELGFINGYRWGVEYKTDGKRPDLADDVVVWWENTDDDTGFSASGILNWDWPGHPVTAFKITDPRYEPADTSYLGELVFVIPGKTGGGGGPIGTVAAFISDIGGAGDPFATTDNGSDWWDDDMHKAVSPAPIGTKLIVDCFGVGWKDAVVIGAFDRWNWIDIGGAGLETVDLCRIKPADHADRKAKAERKKFIDSGCNITDNLRGVFTSDKAAHDVLCALFDAGFQPPKDATK
jgi:hypothetical protein